MSRGEEIRGGGEGKVIEREKRCERRRRGLGGRKRGGMKEEEKR
jgi:hypothetical protein